MSAAKSQNDSNIPADLQPYYDAPKQGSRGWARWLTRILAIIILIVLIFIFVRWVWHQTHDNKPAAGSTSSQTSKSKSSSPASSDHSASSTPSSTSSGTQPATSSSGSSSSATQTVGQSSALTNTGPGDTLAIFVAATVCFAVLYELRLHKQTD